MCSSTENVCATGVERGKAEGEECDHEQADGRPVVLPEPYGQGDGVADGCGSGEPVDVEVVARVANQLREQGWQEQQGQTDEGTADEWQYEECACAPIELGG